MAMPAMEKAVSEDATEAVVETAGGKTDHPKWLGNHNCLQLAPHSPEWDVHTLTAHVR